MKNLGESGTGSLIELQYNLHAPDVIIPHIEPASHFLRPCTMFTLEAGPNHLWIALCTTIFEAQSPQNPFVA